MNRVAIYARVSNEDQHPEARLAQPRVYVERRGLEPVEFVDHGVSGRHRSRPAFDALMAQLGEELLDLGVASARKREVRSTSGHLRRVEEPVAPPAHGEEPGAGLRHRSQPGWVEQADAPPAIEPAPRGGRIDEGLPGERSSPLREVPPRVEEHVRQGVADLTGCPQHVEVVAVREHWAATAEDPVDGPCQARADRLHARGQIVGARGLDDQVQVVGLDRVMDDAEARALAGRSEVLGSLDSRDVPVRPHPLRHQGARAARQRPTRPRRSVTWSGAWPERCEGSGAAAARPRGPRRRRRRP